eukprot:g246.t1
MSQIQGNLPPYARVPTRPGEELPREEMGGYEPQGKEFGFPPWTPGRGGRHVSEDHFNSRNFRNGPPPSFYHERLETRYPDEPSLEPPWRPRSKKRRGSMPPGLDRSRNRPFYVHPEDQQRETADVRVRQQLQGITVIKELCSKDSYQRYLKYSSVPELEKTVQLIRETEKFVGETEANEDEKDETEFVAEVKELIKRTQKRRRGSNYVAKENGSIFLSNAQVDVLRLYYPNSNGV